MGVLGFSLWIALAVFAVDAQTLYKPNDGTGIHMYYKTSWTAPRIHFAINGGSWTAVPGVVMAKSNDQVAFPSSSGWFVYDLPSSATTLEFVFNDGNGVWDNNKNANYKVTAAGTYSVGGVASAPAPTTAPSPVAPTPATPSPVVPPDLSGCDTFPDSCSGLSYPSSTESRRWQTPPRNSSSWTTEYQDFRSLQGYAHVVYAADRRSATVDVRTYLRAAATCVYIFNDAAPTSSGTKTVDSTLTSALRIVIRCSPSGASETWTLALDPVNFVWQNAAVNQPSSMEGGQRGAIVDLFGWPYRDIEAECVDFLGKAGYMGVKINPPQESVLSDVWTKDGQRNPWYLIYQPVSYRLFSRLGSRDELRSMIQTCRKNGVRIYADAVVNHMAAGGYDHNPTHRRSSGSSCSTWGPHSSAKGSPYYTRNFQYQYNKFTAQQPTLEFPAVPFGPSDFHCERGISSWSDTYQLANGWLVGLSDLDTGKTYVRERIAQYFVDLLGIGFSGFRIDAIKHIHPADVAAIFGLFNKYMGGSLPSDFISWGEILLGGEAGFLACDENHEYNFFKGLDKRYRAEGISEADIAKLKIWSSDYPNYHPTCGYWVLPSSRFVIQNDDHDQQAPGSSSREMGDKGSVLIREKNVAKHRQFETQLFSRTDGDWKIKVVLSSYTFGTNGATGFPDGFSTCGGSTGFQCDISMPFEKAFRAGSCGYTVENFASGKYTRVHRDLAIVNAMRTWLGGLGTVSARDVGITGNC